MHSRRGRTAFAGVICWTLLSPAVEAQITETVQKLLPATVAGDILLGEQVATVMCTDVSARAAATGIITVIDDSSGGALPVELLETDVQIGPMSVGAPPANLRGELIGIFVAKVRETAGRSFAVPGKYIRELLDSQKGDEPVIDCSSKTLVDRCSRSTLRPSQSRVSR